MDGAGMMRLLGDPTRAAIVARLAQGERNVGELVELLHDEQTNVSHHLRSLREAGLVVARREGRRQLYRLADAEVARLVAQVEDAAVRLERACYSSRLGLPADASFHGYG